MNLIDQPASKELNSQKGKHNKQCTENYQKSQRLHKSISEELEDAFCRETFSREGGKKEREERKEKGQRVKLHPCFIAKEWGSPR